MDFNYTRVIPDEQEEWMHTPLIVGNRRPARCTRIIFCRFGIRPSCREHIIAVHKTKTQNVFVCRETDLQSIKKLFPSQ